MNLQDYIQQYKNYEDQINHLISEREKYKQENLKEFNQLFNQKCEDDKKWFVEHFNYIWKHKDYLKCKSPFNQIIIEFLKLYNIGGLMAGVGFNGQLNSIYLKDLINLWDEGFIYNNFPIIEYKKIIHNGEQKYITYIENNNLKTIRDDKFDDVNIIKKIKNVAKNNQNHWTNYKSIDILKGLV